MKITDRNDMKLGIAVVLNIVLEAIDFGFKRSRIQGIGSTFQNFGNSCHLANKN